VAERPRCHLFDLGPPLADLRFYAGRPSRLQIFSLKAAAAAEVHRAAWLPLSIARILIRSRVFGEAVLSGTVGDGTVDPQAKPQFWPSP
jgi:hypothetical protein